MTTNEFLEKISKTDFYKIFARELDKIFTYGWVYEDTTTFYISKKAHEKITSISVAVEGTLGWNKALENTLIELRLNDLIKSYHNLNWEKSDFLDSKLGEELIKHCYDRKGKRI